MDTLKRPFVCVLAVLAAAVLNAWLFVWAFVEWEVPFYGLSMALLFLISAAAVVLARRAAGKPVKTALWQGALCAAVYLGVIEAVTYSVNNIWLGGKKPWVAAVTVTALEFLFFLVLSLVIAGRSGFSVIKKLVCVLLCLCMAAAAVPQLVGVYYENSTRLVKTPVFKPYEQPAAEIVRQADFYVSPAGSDQNDGTENAPFATLEKAQNAVRALDKNGRTGVTVAVLPGEYRVSSLRFTAEDSGTPECPVTYCAAGGGEVVLNGGVTLDPAAFTPVTDEEVLARLPENARANVRVTDLTALGITAEQYGKIYAIGSYNTAAKYDGDYVGPLYCELFVNDVRYNLASYPDADWPAARNNPDCWLKTGEVQRLGKGKESNGAPTAVADWDEIRNPESDVYKVDAALAERINGWKTLDDVWMFGFWKYTWADASTPIGEFDYENRTLSPRFVSLYGAIKDAPYYFFNVFEELSSPGEWYLDRANGLLYVYADESFSSAAVDLSLSAETLLSGEGVHDLTFRGFTLKGTRGDAVRIAGDRCTVENCLIKNVAGSALVFEGTGNLALNNEITRTGKAGIVLTGGDPDTLTPGNNKAENNYIHDWSEIYQTYQPAVSLYGAGNVCAHNEIRNSPHEAITYSGPNQLIEYNLIDRVCLISDDAGAIYAGRNWSSYGCVIRYNAIFDLGTPGKHSPQGIYMDDGLSGQTIYGNLLVNVPCFGIQLGGGRDYTVKNNVVINTKTAGVSYDQRAVDGVLEHGWFDHCDQMWEELNTHPWQGEAWLAAFPQYEGLHYDAGRSQEPAFFPNAAGSEICGNVFVNERGELGQIESNPQTYSTFENNPVYRLGEMGRLFADPGSGDYSLRSDSKVFTDIPGFEPLPLSEIGRVN